MRGFSTLLLWATLAGAAGAARAGAAEDLPVIELPAAGAGQLMAIVWSGDGGWRDLDKVIGEDLAAKGVPVVGVDSLRYFWSPRLADELAQDLGGLIETYSRRWQRPKVVLIGYSFGADILPLAYNRLAPAARSRVVQLSLLAFSTYADLEIHVTDFVSTGPHADSLPTAPEAARLGALPVQCFYGADELDSGCTMPELAHAEIIRTSGGHHFDGNYVALADRILAGARSR